MKRNYVLIFITIFLLSFISVAYAAFNSELTITGEGTVLKDTTAPTCGAWYLRDSSLTIQEAYNQNKFINPGTNDTWANTDLTLFIECTDNMSGEYGCINVDQITDSNNNPRYFKDVKQYTTSIQTDSNVVTVTLKDAYLNERTCTLPVGASNPYIDKEDPELTITRSASNKFTYTANDNMGIQGYMVTTTNSTPSLDSENWISTPAEVTIDNTAAKTYYVWAKDGVNIVHDTIKTYKLTKTQGTGTTLTLKFGDSNGAALGTQFVLDGTEVYSLAAPNTGYNTVVLKKGSTTLKTGSGTNSVNSTQTITAATTLSSSATVNTYTVDYDANGGLGTMASQLMTYGTSTALTSNTYTRDGYTFAGWNTKADGTGTSYTNGQSVSNLTTTNNGNVTLYAKWTANTYTLTANANSGTIASTTGWTGTGSTSTKSVTYGSTYGTLPNVSRSGYSLAGWSLLPEGFTQVEYIQSSGTQYINTGVTPDPTMEVIIDFDTTTYGKWILGSRTTNGATNSFGIYLNNATQYWAQIGGNGTNTGGYVNVDSINGRHLIDINGNTFLLDGEEKIKYSNSLSATNAKELFIFGMSNNGTIDGRNLIGKVYSVKILKNGSIVRDLIPCINDTTGKTGLYDIANGVFYGNSATSGNDFTTGNVSYITAESLVKQRSNHTIYAKWAVNQYTLTIDPNGGTYNNTTSNTTVSRNYGTSYDVLNNPTRDGYLFKGWQLTSGEGEINYEEESELVKNYVISSTSSEKPGVYNNSSSTYGQNVTHQIVEDPDSSTGYALKITTNGTASPGAGGMFPPSLNATASSIYYHVIKAKIPTGYTIYSAANTRGANGSDYWITDRTGTTGQYKTYIYATYTGTNAPFSNFGHVYISGSNNTDVTWYVEEYSVYKSTDIEFIFGPGDATLTAQWTPNGSVITFDKQNGAFNTSKWTANSRTYSYLSAYPNTHTVPWYTSSTDYAISREGYTFGGWYTSNSSGTQIFDTNGKLNASISGWSDANRVWQKYDASATLYARWTKQASDLTVTLSQDSYTYDGTAKEPTVTVKDGTTTIPSSAYTVSYSDNTNAGTATATVTMNNTYVSGTKAFYSGSTSATYTITKAANTISTSNITVYAGSTNNNLSAKVSNAQGTLTYSKGSDNTQNSGSSVNSSTGSFTAGVLAASDDANKTVSVTVTAAGNDNYESGTATITVTVRKYDARTLSWSSDSTAANSILTYGVTTYKAVATMSGSGGTAGTVSYSSNNTSGATINSSGAITVVNGNSKAITITASLAGTTTVKTSTSITRAFTTGKATNPLSVTASQTWSEAFSTSAKNKAISSSNGQGTLSYEIQSQKNTSGTTVDYFTISSSNLRRAASTPVSGSNYTVVVRVTAAGNDNYSSGYKDITYTVTVTKATNTMVFTDSQSGSVTYNTTAGGQAKTFTAATSAQGSVTYSITEQKNSGGTSVEYFTIPTSSTASMNVAASTPAGTYTIKIKAHAAGNTNYNTQDITITYTLTVSKASCLMTVANASMTTGGSLDLTTKTSNAVGTVSYAIKTNGTTTASTLSGTNNKTLTAGAMSSENDTAQTVVVTATEATTDNYNTCSKDITVTVNKQTNTLAANSKTVYVSSVNNYADIVTGNNGGALTASVTSDGTTGGSNDTTNKKYTAGVLSASNDNNGSVVLSVTSARTTTVAQKSVNVTLTVQKYTRTLSLTISPSTVKYNSTATLSTTNGSGSGTPGTSITYSSGNTNVFTLSGSSITAVASSGTSVITANRASSTTVKSATATATATASKADCLMTVSNASMNTGNTLDLTTKTSNAVGTVSYTIKTNGTTTASTLSGTNNKTLTAGAMSAANDTAQTVVVTATEAASDNYNTCSKDITVTVNKKSNPTTIAAVTGLKYEQTNSAMVTATSTQGTPYYAVGTALAASNYSTSGSTTIPKVSTRTPSTYTVYYYIPSTTTYAVKSGNVSVTIGKADCKLAVTDGSMTTGGTMTLSGRITSSSTGTKTYAIKTNGTTTASTLSNGTLTAGAMSSENDTAQSVVVTITDPGDSNYNSCSKDSTITVNKQANTLAANNKTVYVSSINNYADIITSNNGGALSATVSSDGTTGGSNDTTNKKYTAGVLSTSNDNNGSVVLSVTSARTTTVAQKSVNVTLTVQKYTNSLSWTGSTPANNAELAYGTSYTATATAATNGGTNGAITYSSGTTATMTINSTSGVISLLKADGSTSVITASMARTSTVKAATTTRTFKTKKGTCPTPTSLAVSTAGAVTWTQPSGASSSQISIDNSTYTAATTGVIYNSTITASTGTRTVYVRSVCDTTYYSQYSSTASKSVTVYSVTLTKGTGISAVSNGGTSTTNAVNYINGRSITIDATVSSGYTWSNWTGTSTITNKSTSITVNGNKAYTANATASNYTVTATANGGTIASTSGWTGTGASATKTVTYNTAYGTLPTVSKPGYTFDGWVDKNLFDKDSTPYMTSYYQRSDGTQTSNGEYSVYKVYIKPDTTYTITNSGASSTPGYAIFNSSNTRIAGSSYSNNQNVTFTTPSTASYILFSVVTKDTSYRYDKETFQLEESSSATSYEAYRIITSETVLQKDTDHIITAKWIPNNYTVTAMANGGTIASTSGWTGTGASATKTVTYGSTYGTLPTVSRPGYTFVGWSLEQQEDILPTGYTRLEYIQSDGYQYMNLNYMLHKEQKAIARLEFTASGNQAIFGTYTGNYIETFGLSGSSKWEYRDAKSGWVSSTTAATINTLYDVELYYGASSQYLKVNGTTVLESTAAHTNNVSSLPAFLLSRNYNGSQNYSAKAKLYSFKLYDGETLVRDMVPCINDSTDEAGMYDLVNGVFYGNEGTGEFVAGSITYITSETVLQKDTDHNINAIWSVNPLTFENQTITKTFSTSSQTANVTVATGGTGTYTYSKVSGDSDITVSSAGVITIPASKTANTTGYTVVIRATDSTSGITKDATYTIKINKASCLMTVSNASMTTGGTLNLTTKTSNAVGTVSYAIKTNGTTTASTLSNSTLTAGAMSSANDTAQTVVVTATEAASDNYNTCSKDITVTVNKQANTLAANNKTVYVNSVNNYSDIITSNNGGALTASVTSDGTTGGSNDTTNKKYTAGVLSTSNDNNGSVVLSVTSARTTTVAQKSVNVTLTVQKYTNALSWTGSTPANNAELAYGTSYTATATAATNGGTNGAITYSSGTTATMTINSTSGVISLLKADGSTSVITASMARTSTVKAATTTRTFKTKKGTCPAPTSLAVSTAGVVTWTKPSAASSSQIAIDSSSYSAATSGVIYNNTITASAGSRTVHVRSVCDTTYYSQYSSASDKAVTVYTLTLTKGSGISAVSPANPTNYISGASASIDATLSTGYTWSSWTAPDESTIATKSTSITMNSDKTYEADATATEYTITYTLNGGSADNPATYTIEDADFTLQRPSKEGYTFAGWTGTGLSSATLDVTITQGSTGNRSYTATWTPNSYYIDLNSLVNTNYVSNTSACGTADVSIKEVGSNSWTKVGEDVTDYNTSWPTGTQYKIDDVKAPSSLGCTYTGETSYIGTLSNSNVAINLPYTFSSRTFDYTGDMQSFTVPVSGQYRLEVWGAQGGNSTSHTGGLGGYTNVSKCLTGGDTLYVGVGGTTTSYTGGFNGGNCGNGWFAGDCPNYADSDYTHASSVYAAGGGGATHIGTINDILYNYTVDQRTPNYIFAVAGGGGGGSEGNNGGAGGKLNGTDGGGSYGGKGGSSTNQAGGAGGNNVSAAAGTFGLGGHANKLGSVASGVSRYWAGGGGGGLYGGGGGDWSTSNSSKSYSGAGGGGSGTQGLPGYPQFGGTGTAGADGVREGDGQAIITYEGTCTSSSTTYNDIVLDYNINDQTFAAPSWMNTYYAPDWSKSFDVDITFTPPTTGKRYVVYSNYDTTSTNAFAIEVNTNNQLVLWVGSSSPTINTTFGTVTIGAENTVHTSWDATTGILTITTSDGASGSYIGYVSVLVGVADRGFKIGAFDYRGGSSNVFNAITVNDFIITEHYASPSSAAITLPDPAGHYLLFEGWTGSNGNSPQYGVTLPSGSSSDVTYTANWSEGISFSYAYTSGDYSTSNQYIKYRFQPEIVYIDKARRVAYAEAAVKFYRTNDYKTTYNGSIKATFNGRSETQTITTSQAIVQGWGNAVAFWKIYWSDRLNTYEPIYYEADGTKSVTFTVDSWSYQYSLSGSRTYTFSLPEIGPEP